MFDMDLGTTAKKVLVEAIIALQIWKLSHHLATLVPTKGITVNITWAQSIV